LRLARREQARRQSTRRWVAPLPRPVDPPVGSAPPQASRKGWPYYIRPLHQRHDTFVYSRASRKGWPACWRLACLLAAGLLPTG